MNSRILRIRGHHLLQFPLPHHKVFVCKDPLDDPSDVLVKTMEEGVMIANDFAPEHVLLISRREKSLLPKIKTAGAIFLGNYSAVAVGDFLAGPSHTLPTGGAGKSFPGLTVDQFQRRTSVVKLDRSALEKSAPIVQTFAAMEGLDAQGRSASIRLEK